MKPLVLHLLVAVAALWLVARPASAHDFWIEPARHTAVPGAVLGVRLRVGEHFQGDAVGRPGAGVRRFDVSLGAERRSIPGRAGADPAGAVRLTQPGLYTLVYHSEPIAIELPADKFTAYLREEGLDAVVAQRAAEGRSGEPGREIYSRSAKSLVMAGPASTAQADRTIGLPLELIADDHPYLAAPGERLAFRLLHEGRALPGTLVVALHRAHPQERVSARSDAEGRVRLRLRWAGDWLVKAVHMVPTPAGSAADWHSLWASLTFHLNDQAAP